jgi:transposase-like protein
MAENGVTRMNEGQRWTSKKKAAAVLEIIKGNTTLVDFCRANDLKQSDVQKWADEFVAGGTQCLKANQKT